MAFCVSKIPAGRKPVGSLFATFLVSELETRSLLNRVADQAETRVLDLSGQATKGAWGMSWH